MAGVDLGLFYGVIGGLWGSFSFKLAVYEKGRDRHASEAVFADGDDQAVSEYLLSAGLRGGRYTFSED
jgi:hypothetical protein